jgi:hypothetical protein
MPETLSKVPEKILGVEQKLISEDITINSSLLPPNLTSSISLIVQYPDFLVMSILHSRYYRDNSPERQKELDACLRYNLQNSYISAVYVLVEKEEDLPFLDQFDKSKMNIVKHYKRLSYQDAFKFANETLKGTKR